MLCIFSWLPFMPLVPFGNLSFWPHKAGSARLAEREREKKSGH